MATIKIYLYIVIKSTKQPLHKTTEMLALHYKLQRILDRIGPSISTETVHV
jgi:hypothetical protein